MPANFIDLPPEVIGEIFSFLTKTNDRRRVAQVCWRFYKIIRRQSQRNDQLKLFIRDFDSTAISVFENSTIFPFSKLYIERKFDLTPDSGFWQQNGMQIIEITMEDDKVNTNRFLTSWSAYFPNLRTLRMVKGSLEDFRFKFEEASTPNSPDLPLAIKELYIETDRLDLSTIQRLQRAAPSLKRLHLAVGDANMVPDLLEWIESVEMVTVNAENVSLADIATNLNLLPSKVIFTVLRVEVNSINVPKILDEFLETPRLVETLDLEWPNDTAKQMMMEQIKLLLKVKSVRNLRVFIDSEICCQRMDLLAQLPGLETIEMKGQISHALNPFWSTPSTAAKIRSINFFNDRRINFEGLCAITSLTIVYFTDEVTQALSQHCPNLKELRTFVVKTNEATLISIASLSNLEKLSIYLPEINRSFEQTYQFSKLKQLEVHILKIDINSVEPLVANCPNLERLILYSDKFIKDGFDRLFRRLPYLMEITFKCFLLSGPPEKLTIKSEYLSYTN